MLRARLACAFGEGSNALNLLLLALLARFLGVSDYGVLMAILAVASILGELIELGFPPLVIRSVAVQKESAWPAVSHALKLQIIMVLPMLGILYAYMGFSQISPENHVPGLLIGASVAFKSLKGTLRALCRGLERFALEAFFLWTERLCLVLLALAFLSRTHGLWGPAWIFFVVRGVDFAAFFLFSRRLAAREGPKCPAPFTWAMAIPFALASIFWSLYYQIDTALLSVFSTGYETGLYAALYRFWDALQVIPRLVITVVYPAMSLAWVEDRDRFAMIFDEHQQFLTCALLPVLAIFIVWSRPLMALVFGEAYEEGSKALRLILVGTFLASHSLFYFQTLRASGQEVRLAWGLLGNVIFNVLLNLYLIPRHGALGAAVAALLTEMTYYLTLVAFAWKTGPWLPPATVAWVFAGVAVLGLLTFTADLPTNPLVGPGALVLVLAGWAVFMVRKRPDRLLWRPTL